MITIFGLKACDSCRKARRAFEAAGARVTFVDLRETPPDRALRAAWLDQFGDRLVNTRSTTWRALDAAQRDRPAAELLSAHPALMKRPLIARDGRLFLGWKPADHAAILGPASVGGGGAAVQHKPVE